MRPVLVLVTGLPGTGKSTMAEAAAGHLGAAVLAHDWAMSGLRPYPEVQAALAAMVPTGHRTVGGSVLSALARAQLRAGRSVVLDGVARPPQADQAARLAADEGAAFVLVVTSCRDAAVHRSRVEGRRRHIPDWYELTWDEVERSRAAWEPPAAPDLELDAVDDLATNGRRLEDHLQGLDRSG